ncbi:SH3 domain-containing protein [uncultured Algimonas sp.]|uniref:SH3 domain-containing protein n=1 Tax=uncultured Algimonas sp. TaxID=1547920 RepID=UPI0026383948|nr:SH3 domain-containing protein [uncultured Algimonas sp.]
MISLRTLTASAILALAAAVVAPSNAKAQTIGFTIDDIPLRAGPGARFPTIVVLAEDNDIEVLGCVRHYTWCDVSAGRFRGWVPSDDLDIVYMSERYHGPVYARQYGVPVISFELNTYWDAYYDDYDFYDSLDYWDDYDWWEDRTYWYDWEWDDMDLGPDTIIIDGETGGIIEVEEPVDCLVELPDGSLEPC